MPITPFPLLNASVISIEDDTINARIQSPRAKSCIDTETQCVPVRFFGVNPTCEHLDFIFKSKAEILHGNPINRRRYAKVNFNGPAHGYHPWDAVKKLAHLPFPAVQVEALRTRNWATRKLSNRKLSNLTSTEILNQKSLSQPLQMRIIKEGTVG